MATEEIQISQLELAQEVQGDMVFAVDTATDTKSLSVNQLKNHISQPLQANINAVDTSALHKHNISNCITEIPQDIKLELNNGTLTLKAGSKVYVPNGAGIFDEVTTSADYSLTNTSNDTYMVFAESDGSDIKLARLANQTGSGTTTPTSSWWVYYNTLDNKVYRIENGVNTRQVSLPIAIITVSSGAISSIDQVFNGFGYIGSTVFALPGVKGLIPNGRNADGTLKNTEFTVSNVISETRQNYGTGVRVLKLGANYISGMGKINYRYDEINNFNYEINNLRNYAILGELVTTNNKIDSFTMPTAFHAVDYNDFEKAMLKEDWVRVSTAPASPDSSKFYYIPEN